MIGIASTKKKPTLPPPSTNTTPSVKQDYMTAMGLPPVQQPEVTPQKKKKVHLDSGGQLFRGELRGA
jgi:hypothetical protein